jgi:hypothetical protein
LTNPREALLAALEGDGFPVVPITGAYDVGVVLA